MHIIENSKNFLKVVVNGPFTFPDSIWKVLSKSLKDRIEPDEEELFIACLECQGELKRINLLMDWFDLRTVDSKAIESSLKEYYSTEILQILKAKELDNDQLSLLKMQ